MSKILKKIHINEEIDLTELFGIHDINLKNIEKAFNVSISARGGNLSIEGSKKETSDVYDLIEQITDLIKNGVRIDKDGLNFIIRMKKFNKNIKLMEVFSEKVKISLEDKYIIPKSFNQKEYIYAVKNFDIVMGIGPAGTGKTFLAMALAVSGLIHKRFSRIILVRPAVEAGEKLGFLPGDMYEKINPYLRPLYDALFSMMDIKKAKALIANETIEIAPLAYMRGRTLNDSFIILDEAQNSTPEQMKMFLTRLGQNSKVVVTGDITQVDLPSGQSSGLIKVQNILKNIDDIEFIYFSEKDVVRHELVQKIIKAYEKHEQKK